MIKSGFLSGRNKTKNFLDSILAVIVLGGISVACFIPTGVFLLAYFLLSPQGFWQKFVVFGAGACFLGIFQFVGLVFLTIFWVSLLLRST
jgi:hypothetical protein